MVLELIVFKTQTKLASIVFAVLAFFLTIYFNTLLSDKKEAKLMAS
jgi:hypothetical protein